MTFRFLTTLALLSLVLTAGCNTTHRVAYPAADDLFVTMGDDPGSESPSSYTPKGTLIHSSNELHIPFPILGLLTFGKAEPQHVFETYVLPKIREMGGDALTSSRVQHTPRPHWFWRLLGLPLIFRESSQTVVIGQVVKR